MFLFVEGRDLFRSSASQVSACDLGTIRNLQSLLSLPFFAFLASLREHSERAVNLKFEVFLPLPATR